MQISVLDHSTVMISLVFNSNHCIRVHDHIKLAIDYPIPLKSIWYLQKQIFGQTSSVCISNFSLLSDYFWIFFEFYFENSYRNKKNMVSTKKESKKGKIWFPWIGGEFKEAKVIEITLHCACFYVLAFVVSPFPILHFEAEILRWRRSGSQTPMEGTSTLGCVN